MEWTFLLASQSLGSRNIPLGSSSQPIVKAQEDFLEILEQKKDVAKQVSLQSTPATSNTPANLSHPVNKTTHAEPGLHTEYGIEMSNIDHAAENQADEEFIWYIQELQNSDGSDDQKTEIDLDVEDDIEENELEAHNIVTIAHWLKQNRLAFTPLRVIKPTSAAHNKISTSREAAALCGKVVYAFSIGAAAHMGENGYHFEIGAAAIWVRMRQYVRPLY